MYKIKIWDTEVEGSEPVMEHACQGMALLMDGVEMEHGEGSKVAAAAYLGKASSAQRMATSLTRSALEENSHPFRMMLADVMRKRDDNDYMDKLMRLILLDMRDMLKDKIAEAEAEE